MPAELLRNDAAAQWVRRGGLVVDANGADELGLALAAGLPPGRVVADCADTSTVEKAVAAGIGRFVVGDVREALSLAGCTRSSERVLLDVTQCALTELAAAVMPMKCLDVVGLQFRLGKVDCDGATDALHAMVCQMAWLRREYGVILTRACLIGFRCNEPGGVRRHAELLQLTVEDACAECRYPRPALVLSLHQGAIVGSR